MREARAMLEGILGPRVHDYLDAIGATTQAVVYALILGALAQGAVAGIGYWIFGVEGAGADGRGDGADRADSVRRAGGVGKPRRSGCS